MPTRRGFVQGYNAQVAFTGDHVITAVDVNQQPNDMPSFVPMMNAATVAAAGLHARTGSPEHQIGVVLVDAGYCHRFSVPRMVPDNQRGPDLSPTAPRRTGTPQGRGVDLKPP